MLKKRLIFTLLYCNGSYMLSRNFRLQAVGDLEWLRENYDFDAIAQSIDELVVLDVTRGQRDTAVFAEHLRQLSSSYFLPIAAGGGVRTLEDGYRLLSANADKLVVNSALVDDPALVSALARTFGNQSVVASIDCRKTEAGYRAFSHNGETDSGLDLANAVARAAVLGAGESGVAVHEDREDREAARPVVGDAVHAGTGHALDHRVDGLEVRRVRGE